MFGERPGECTAITLPPCTPKYGFGNSRTHRERKEGIKEARKVVKGLLQDVKNDFAAKEVGAMHAVTM